MRKNLLRGVTGVALCLSGTVLFFLLMVALEHWGGSPPLVIGGVVILVLSAFLIVKGLAVMVGKDG